MADLTDIEKFRAAKALQNKQAGVDTPANDERTPPDPFTFEVNLMSGGLVKETGYLVPSSAFVGIGDAEGYITAVYPLEQLHYVRRTDAAEAA